MNAPVTRRALLGATAALGAVALPAAAEAVMPASSPDAVLHGLIARHTQALAAWYGAAEELEAAGTRADAAYPPRPGALYQPSGDYLHDLGGAAQRVTGPDGLIRFAYNFDDIDRLRAAGPVLRTSYTDDGDPGVLVPDADGEARRREILAAHDRWMAQRGAVDRRVGLTAAQDAEAQMCDALHAAEAVIEAYVPATLAAVRLKARWLLAQPGADEEAVAFLRQLAGEVDPPADASAARVAA